MENRQTVEKYFVTNQRVHRTNRFSLGQRFALEFNPMNLLLTCSINKLEPIVTRQVYNLLQEPVEQTPLGCWKAEEKTRQFEKLSVPLALPNLLPKLWKQKRSRGFYLHTLLVHFRGGSLPTFRGRFQGQMFQDL